MTYVWRKRETHGEALLRKRNRLGWKNHLKSKEKRDREM